MQQSNFVLNLSDNECNLDDSETDDSEIYGLIEPEDEPSSESDDTSDEEENTSSSNVSISEILSDSLFGDTTSDSDAVEGITAPSIVVKEVGDKEVHVIKEEVGDKEAHVVEEEIVDEEQLAVDIVL